MKKSEKDALKQKIQAENILVRRLGSWVKIGGIIFLVTVGLCVWGFTGMNDPILPNISDTVRNVVKWIALVGAVLSGGFTIMSFLSFRNGKKHVLAMINELKGF